MATRDYLLRLPRDTTVVAACEETRCENWLYGWDTVLDERTPAGRELAAWIRSGQSGRDFRELGAGDGGTVVFRFGPHQRCFAEHRTRPARWLVRSGQRVTAHQDMQAWIGDLDDHVSDLHHKITGG
jgi:hypothetical protein